MVAAANRVNTVDIGDDGGLPFLPPSGFPPLVDRRVPATRAGPSLAGHCWHCPGLCKQRWGYGRSSGRRAESFSPPVSRIHCGQLLRQPCLLACLLAARRASNWAARNSRGQTRTDGDAEPCVSGRLSPLEHRDHGRYRRRRRRRRCRWQCLLAGWLHAALVHSVACSRSAQKAHCARWWLAGLTGGSGPQARATGGGGCREDLGRGEKGRHDGAVPIKNRDTTTLRGGRGWC